MLVQVFEDGEELRRVATAAGDHDQQRARALVPIMEITTFILHRCLCGVEGHDCEE